MAIYRVKRNGKEYVYNYDRSKYHNNTTEYNKDYWEKNKGEIGKKAKLRRLQTRLEAIKDGQKEEEPEPVVEQPTEKGKRKANKRKDD